MPIDEAEPRGALALPPPETAPAAPANGPLPGADNIPPPDEPPPSAWTRARKNTPVKAGKENTADKWRRAIAFRDGMSLSTIGQVRRRGQADRRLATLVVLYVNRSWADVMRLDLYRAHLARELEDLPDVRVQEIQSYVLTTAILVRRIDGRLGGALKSESVATNVEGMPSIGFVRRVNTFLHYSGFSPDWMRVVRPTATGLTFPTPRYIRHV